MLNLVLLQRQRIKNHSTGLQYLVDFFCINTFVRQSQRAIDCLSVRAWFHFTLVLLLGDTSVHHHWLSRPCAKQRDMLMYIIRFLSKVSEHNKGRMSPALLVLHPAGGAVNDAPFQHHRSNESNVGSSSSVQAVFCTLTVVFAFCWSSLKLSFRSNSLKITSFPAMRQRTGSFEQL